jgi:uncharacterized protein YoxC|tara:strand:+ start:487 stop:726 length:240 start_codon:yes stop_codon:yes gene_type:complete
LQNFLREKEELSISNSSLEDKVQKLEMDREQMTLKIKQLNQSVEQKEQSIEQYICKLEDLKKEHDEALDKSRLTMDSKI